MWQLGTWFSDWLGNVRFTVGLDDLKNQPKLFYDSMVSCLTIKAQGKEEEGGTFVVKAFAFPSNRQVC